MENKELLAVRQQILDSALPLLLNTSTASGEQFDLLLRFLRYSSGVHASEIYQKAYQAAMSFENADERLQALLELLGEVDAEIDQDSGTSESFPEEEPQPLAEEALSEQ